MPAEAKEAGCCSLYLCFAEVIILFISNVTRCRGSVVKSEWSRLSRIQQIQIRIVSEGLVLIVALVPNMSNILIFFSLLQLHHVSTVQHLFARLCSHILAYGLDAISLVNLPLHKEALLLDWIRLD